MQELTEQIKEFRHGPRETQGGKIIKEPRNITT